MKKRVVEENFMTMDSNILEVREEPWRTSENQKWKLYFAWKNMQEEIPQL